jgi:hypothetical protein
LARKRFKQKGSKLLVSTLFAVRIVLAIASASAWRLRPASALTHRHGHQIGFGFLDGRFVIPAAADGHFADARWAEIG